MNVYDFRGKVWIFFLNLQNKYGMEGKLYDDLSFYYPHFFIKKIPNKKNVT